MAQPDFERLADGFSIIAKEFTNLPNVPVINEGRTLIDSINVLRRVMEQQFRDLNTRIDGLSTRVDGLGVRIDNIDLHMRAE